MAPNKSSLSRLRKSISYEFFASKFKALIKGFESSRQTWQGLRVYAIDGQQMVLPRVPEVIEAGYTGRAISRYRESYLPRGYFTHAYDVLSKVTKGFTFGPRLNEVADAKHLIRSFEKNSLTIYDRLYLSKDLMRRHFKMGNYFLFRCRRNHSKAIAEFAAQKIKSRITVKFEGKNVLLFKLYNPKTKTQDLFATNLDPKLITPKKIKALYRLRWEVEISFKELTAITKVQQWHSKAINGIYQEIYALMWLINFTKIQMANTVKKQPNHLSTQYRKANFKLVLNYIVFNFPRLLKRVRKLNHELNLLIKNSTQKRQHFKRSYPRQIRGPASPYKYNNTVWNLA